MGFVNQWEKFLPEPAKDVLDISPEELEAWKQAEKARVGESLARRILKWDAEHNLGPNPPSN